MASFVREPFFDKKGSFTYISQRETLLKNGKNIQMKSLNKRMKIRENKVLMKKYSLEEKSLAQLNDINITNNSLKWAQLTLSHYFVQKQSLYFILDSSFEHYW